MDATLSYINGEPTLRFERRLRHSPAKVWRAVTDPAEMVHWFPTAVEAELRPGAPMRFTFPEEAVVDGTWDGEVLEVDEPKVFMFRWHEDVLRLEIIPEGDGCLLVFTQTVGGGQTGLLAVGRTAAGWDTCLDVLVAGLDGTTSEERTDWHTPMAHYLAKFGVDAGKAAATADGWTITFARDLVWKKPDVTWPMLRTTPDEKVIAKTPPRRLVHEWLHDGTPAGTATWEFHSDPKLGERVEVTVTAPHHLRARALAVWHHRMELYFAATMGETGRPWSAERVGELAKRYATNESD